MKFLICSNDYKPNDGGVAEFAFQVAHRIARTGATVHILAPQMSGAGAFDASVPELVTHRIPKLPYATLMSLKGIFRRPDRFLVDLRRWSRYAQYMTELTRSEQYDHVLCFYWDPFALLARKVQDACDVPYSVVVHGTEVRERQQGLSWKLRQGLQWKLQSIALSGSHTIFANSDYTQLRAERNVRTGPKFVVTHCGVDTRAFFPGPKCSNLLARHDLEGKKVILSLTRLVRRKGIDNTIRALAQHWKRKPDSRVVYLVAGKGPDGPRLLQIAEELGVSNRVKFLGFIPDAEKLSYYRIADAFVMPSRELDGGDVEGFGIVYAEANSCGIPVVAGQSGGIGSIISHGINGLLVDPENIDDILDAIERILTDTDLARHLGANGRQLMVEKFSWDAVTERFLCSFYPMTQHADLRRVAGTTTD